MNPQSTTPSLPPEMEAWLAEHPEIPRAALAETWQLTGDVRLDDAPAPDPSRIEAMWTFLEHATAPAHRPALRRVERPAARPALQLVHPHATRWVALAACIVILFGVAVGLWTQRPTTLTAPVGQTFAATLPDGSSVQLNSGSTLVYRHGLFADTRQVELKGEAFFQVAHDADAFVVQTFNTTATVVGTRFNVRSWGEDLNEASTIAVLSGKVRVQPKGANESVIVAAGQITRVAGADQAPAQPIFFAADEALAWREGGFYFEDQTLASVFAEFERRFGVAIDADADVLSRRITLKRDARQLDVLLEDLAAATSLRYRETANGYEVYAE